MQQTISIKSSEPIGDIRELNQFTEAILIVDEVFRLIKEPELITRKGRIDFRLKEYRELKGAELSELRVNSPIEISIQVDNLWIGALGFILANYKAIKENTSEINSDVQSALKGISGLTSEQIRQIDIGVRLFYDQLLELSEKELKSFLRKIQTARHRINYRSIESVSVANNDKPAEIE